MPAAIYNFTLATPWNATITGATTITVTVSNTNGGDTNLNNNSVTRNTIVVNEVFPKTVVFEEGTGTWCGACVAGLVRLKDMAHNHPVTDFIGIAVHNDDPMADSDYDSSVSELIDNTYPRGIMNRGPEILDPDTLESNYQVEATKKPLAKINIPDVMWNPTTDRKSVV